MVAIPQDLLPAFRLLFGANDIPPSIDVRSLKRVYRRRALATHPDRASATGADPVHLTRLFQEVTVAYDRLLEFVARSNGRVSPAPVRPAPRPAPRPSRPEGAPGRDGPTTQSRARPAGAQARPRPAAAGASSRAGVSDDATTGATGRGAQGPRARAEERSRPNASAHAPRASTQTPPSRDAGRKASPGAGPAGSGARPAASARASTPPRNAPAAEAPSVDHFWGGRLPNRPLLIGQFLYYSGRISFRALIGAIHWQRSQRPHFGQLAVQMGYLPAELVHSLLTLKRFEERIGDAAVRLGVLSQDKRDRLLALQRVAQRPFGQYFVDAGLLHPDDLRHAVTGQFQHNFVRASQRGR